MERNTSSLGQDLTLKRQLGPSSDVAGHSEARCRPRRDLSLSPTLLALLYDLGHVGGGPYLEDVAVLQGRMLRHELCGMVQIASFKDENAAELFLGFRIGT